jgi:phosphatidylserine/phosphatidylglycerophosphate/cardiolipin synthase-like enzyme
MIDILNTPIYGRFLDLCSEAEESIKLCAPFVKEDVVKTILEAKSPDSSLDLITNVNARSFQQGSSDVKALDRILNCGGNVYNNTNLHAKFYVFDDSKCIITSANLTASGLKRNYEYGVITDDARLVSTAASDYLSLSRSEGVGCFESEQLAEMEKTLERMPARRDLEMPDACGGELILREGVKEIYDGFTASETWKRDVFFEMDRMQKFDFDSKDVEAMAFRLVKLHPDNNNREAKVRQILQQFRDMGLVRFVSPGKYRRLWAGGKI